MAATSKTKDYVGRDLKNATPGTTDPALDYMGREVKAGDLDYLGRALA